MFEKTIETVAQTPQQPKLLNLENTHFTIGEISVLISFVATIASFLWLAAKVGASASEVKNSFVLMDVKITNDLGALSSKTETGFAYIKAELGKQNVRININAAKLKDVEHYLIKSGYIPRQYDVNDSI